MQEPGATIVRITRTFGKEGWHAGLLTGITKRPPPYVLREIVTTIEFREQAVGYAIYLRKLVELLDAFSPILIPGQERDDAVRDEVTKHFWKPWKEVDGFREKVLSLTQLVEESAEWFDFKVVASMLAQAREAELPLPPEIMALTVKELDQHAAFANQYGAPKLFVDAPRLCDEIRAVTGVSEQAKQAVTFGVTDPGFRLLYAMRRKRLTFDMLLISYLLGLETIAQGGSSEKPKHVLYVVSGGRVSVAAG